MSNKAKLHIAYNMYNGSDACLTLNVIIKQPAGRHYVTGSESSAVRACAHLLVHCR